MVILSAMFEYGWIFFMRSTLIIATREGCRTGAVVPPDDSPSPESVAEQAIVDYMTQFNMDCSDESANCEITVTTNGDSPSETLVCNTIVQYNPITGLVPYPEEVTSQAITLFELQR